METRAYAATFLFAVLPIGAAVSRLIVGGSTVTVLAIARLDHVAHEQVADPFCVLAIRLVALLRLGVLGMGEGDENMLFKDIEYWDPVFSG